MQNNLHKNLGFNVKNIEDMNFFFEKYEEIFCDKVPCIQIFVFGKKTKPLLTQEKELELKKLDINIYVHCIFTVTMTRYFPAVPSIIEHIKISERIGAKGIIVHLPRENEKEIYNVARRIGQEVAKMNSGKGTEVIIYFEHVISEYFVQHKNMIKLYKRLKKMFKTPIGLCFDTCHMYGSGYDISSEKSVLEYFDDSYDFPVLIHLNDSQDPLNSGIDHHGDLCSNIWKEDQSGLKKILDMGYDCIIELSNPVESFEAVKSIESSD